ncbi:EAL domain-containing protein [Devosia sp.]|uniref:putative bifunctional diguanylate cyclase/phosphodiesterase n=1 Tax=Devosia sp. TaxID=1871048 RepID=UPI003264D6DC
MRRRLLMDQFRSMEATSGAVLVGMFVVTGVMTAVCRGQPEFMRVAIWAGLFWVIGGLALGALAIHRRKSEDSVSIPASIGQVLGFTFVCALMWAAGFVVMPVASDPTIRNAAMIGIGGMLFIGMVALLSYPQAMLLYVLTMVSGIATNLLRQQDVPDLWARSMLLFSMLVVMTVICLRLARLFVAQRASDAQVRERGEIIGLLLREFEQSSSNWIWGFDKDGQIDRLSTGFTAATGVGEDALLGADFIHFLRCITPPNDPFMAQLESDCAHLQTFQDIELRVTAGGQECWWSMTGKPAFDQAGGYIGYIGTGADISERKVAEQRITLLAHHDPMTGLINRTKFTDHLNHCVARLERYGAPFSLLFMDLDQFKSINDSRGHLIGDRLLIMVAKRIQALARETDYVARLGGDEFAIILPNDCSPEGNATLAARLIEEVKKPYQIDDDVLSIGISIGIAMAPANGTRPDQILRNADLALYRAKADGRSVYRFFENQMDSEARERRMLEVELRDALRNDELLLYYQPLVAADDRRPVGFEALIRWNHPIRGLVPPAEFIPIAERSSLIVEIGDWTIEQACRTATTWPEGMTVAVNVSAKHFRLSDIAMVVKRALSLSGLEPHRLEIEITEGLLMENPDEVTAKLAEIRALGVTIAMDDFGTGYSSLSYLLKFPFDKIKIDRSFINASTDDPVARDILKAIASLGKTLKLKITAEGVETAEQADFLSGINCHQLQGYFFARPLDSIDMPHYLLTHVPSRSLQVKAEAESILMARRAR